MYALIDLIHTNDKKYFYINTVIQETPFLSSQGPVYWISNGFMNLMNNYASLISMTLTERACYVMHGEQ